MTVATMNIKDPQVRELARELAAVRGTTATAAVRAALEETLERDRENRADVLARLEQICERSAARGERVLTDDDLYDDAGLPR